MKILVAVKRVIDYNVQVRVKEDNTGVVTDNVKMSTNPPDDNAIEEAVKIKESGKATEVVAELCKIHLEEYPSTESQIITETKTASKEFNETIGAAAASPKSPPKISNKTLEDVLKEFDLMVGMEAIKQQILNLVNLHQLNTRRTEEGLDAVPVGLHLVFTGNPGTGKTTVARLVAELYRALGLLPKGQLVETQRSELVAGYLGQTAIQVQEVL